MIDTITQNTFTDAMIKNGFSYEGTIALFNYLEELENDTETKIEFDPVSLRCEYDEYKNLKEVQENYNDITSLEDLRNNTTVIEIPNSEKLIIQAY